MDSRVDYLAPDDDQKAHRRCKCEFSGGGFPSKVCAYHSRLAAPPVEGGEAVAWCKRSEWDDAKTKRMSFNVWRQNYGDCDMAFYTRPADSEALLREWRDNYKSERDGMDKLLDDLNVAVSCINPTEDLRRAIVALKSRAEAAEAALRSAGERVREAAGHAELIAAMQSWINSFPHNAPLRVCMERAIEIIRALPVQGEVNAGEQPWIDRARQHPAYAEEMRSLNAPTEPPLAGEKGAGEWLPIETAPKDNKRPLLIARFNDDGTLQSIDHDAVWESDRESWEIPQVYYFWASAHGLVEEPSHWMYQPDWYAKLSTTPPAGAKIERSNDA